MTRRTWIGWQFTAPFLGLFTMVFLAPIAYSAYLSVFRTRLVGGTTFVGLENYTKALSDPQFWEAVTRVALFLLIQVPIMLGLALLVALAIDSGRLYGAGFFRVAIFLPYAVPSVVATLMAGFLYGIRFGLVGSINEALGLNLPDPLAPGWVLATIGNIVTWEYVGYNMLILYSGLKVIDASLYEAAAIDGAGELRIIRAIKLPALRGPLVVATIFSIVGSFQLFNEPQVLDSLAPNSITTYFTPNIYAYQLSFAGQQINYSATIALLMGVATMVVAYLFQLRAMRGEAR
ncbi:multiple sugar transport system permease protein [Actinoplanes campanulatus]|uniref:Multiple sugar transport system permease protein n=1 Tax=Actinoplanes campanulatus TaxID=113559 RepID=A0A7W5AFP6_9ACTN|nr:sugar ABC transporter permease [Actinoplanes campanulatus]MBB3095195.1 multiple sugar transport system permease protein [Actinoplanes campanulatus]GGN24062.1 ABC transporter permease [Actinoplanes campanulatus]GID34799.1 ABC transporter permease [Actinoplanes campanulatus]